MSCQPTLMSTALEVKETFPPGSDSSWAEWRCLNRLRSGVGRCKVSMKEWGYTASDTTCQCGTEQQDMTHLIRCPLLERQCTMPDLAEFNDSVKACVSHWLKMKI